MAVTWIDSAGSTLASVSEPIDFTTDEDVVAVSVSFGSGIIEERAYRDGVFLHPYLGSTQNGHTFSLVRTGGWPERPVQVFVDELEALPTEGAEWDTIYSVDLTAEATADLSATGVHTVAGLNWYSKGASAFGGGNLNRLVNGSGLEAAASAFQTTTTLNYQCLWFPFTQIADFNPNSPTAVVWRWAGSGLDTNNYVVAGLASMVDDGTNWQTAERASQALVEYRAASSGGAGTLRYGNSSGAMTLSPASTTLGNHSFGVARLTSRVHTSLHQAYAGTLPEDVNAITSGLSPVVHTGTLSNPGFVFTRNETVAYNVYLTHLAIMQPRISA
jgi:hypothetical protein